MSPEERERERERASFWPRPSCPLTEVRQVGKRGRPFSGGSRSERTQGTQGSPPGSFVKEGKCMNMVPLVQDRSETHVFMFTVFLMMLGVL